jgi:hypothetical protein
MAAEVIVGIEQRKFIIHPEILCKQSQFFQSACSQRWNADSKPIALPDTTPQTFNDYLTLVYRDKVGKAQEVQSYIARLIRLYLFADKLGDLKAANKGIDRIIKFSNRNATAPEYGIVAMVMTETPENSPLRSLMVGLYVHEVTANSFRRRPYNIPAWISCTDGERVCQDSQWRYRGEAHQISAEMLLSPT